jgi:hypothetical protein
LLDSLLQEVEATLPHLVLQKRKNDTEERSQRGGVKEKGEQQGVDPRQIAKSGRIAPGCQHRRLIADGSAGIAS